MKELTQKRKHVEDSEDHWISTADLMSGLMIVFLFIAVAYMYNMQNIAKSYVDTKKEIYDALYIEFKDDLSKKDWGASIDPKTLTITFNAPNIQFSSNQTELKTEYQNVLNDFFPRYLDVLMQYKTSINEVRIEGHTDSKWFDAKDDTQAYFKNMALSQGRSRSVLEYVYSLDSVKQLENWMKQNISAVGFSSAKVIHNSDGKENEEASRRVSFRVITNAEKSIDKILGVGVENET